jgi:hypothetical protein
MDDGCHYHADGIAWALKHRTRARARREVKWEPLETKTRTNTLTRAMRRLARSDWRIILVQGTPSIRGYGEL